MEYQPSFLRGARRVPRRAPPPRARPGHAARPRHLRALRRRPARRRNLRRRRPFGPRAADQPVVGRGRRVHGAHRHTPPAERRPAQRRRPHRLRDQAERAPRGHATAMLAAALPMAAAMGIDPALITCDVNNTISRRVIEANGGRYAGRDDDELHFWVPTTSALEALGEPAAAEAPTEPALKRRGLGRQPPRASSVWRCACAVAQVVQVASRDLAEPVGGRAGAQERRARSRRWPLRRRRRARTGSPCGCRRSSPTRRPPESPDPG